MTYKTLQTNFERELLLHLITNMRKGSITTNKAKAVAKSFLEILKTEETIAGFMDHLSKVSQFYPEIREAFLIFASDYETENVRESLQNTRNTINNLNIIN